MIFLMRFGHVSNPRITFSHIASGNAEDISIKAFLP
jgi:hypothetical protein